MMRWLMGSQCNCFINGVIWSYFLLPVTSRAAQFCTFCNRSIRNLGNPYNKELQLSSFDVIKAWTKVWISDVDKYSFILAIFLKWKKQFLQILVTCLSIDMWWSKVTPMFRAEVLGWIIELDTSIYSTAGHKRFREILILMYCLLYNRFKN